jgi:ABC-type phosphate transport system substrate-binding protein
MKIFLLKSGLLIALLLAGSFRALALDGVVVIANSSVATDNLSADELKDIYTGKTTYWPDGQSIKIAVLDDQITDKTDAALEEVSGMTSTSQFKTFWQRMVFSGRGQQPKYANDAAALVAYVASTKGAIAIVLADADVKGVKTIEINQD